MPRFLGKLAFTALGALAVGYSLVKRSRQPRGTRRRSTREAAFIPFVETPYGLPRSAAIGFVLLLIAVAAGYAAHAYRDMRQREQRAERMTGGDITRAAAHVVRYGCAGCHTIPGISRANGLVGPPLDSISRRIYVAGMLPNSPENLIRWIVNPRDVNPKTAMPVTGISEDEARDVAAYLYSLR
ncbi:cytochrome c family protein [Microvirga sp. TS319]|uniref:c-type cytochrome n=1 Tax=Microvirga sp. TS319 TaxID=3241165 RepID=UPI00351AA4D7